MKLRSTLLFAAASLTASALAPVAMTTSAYGAGESISINFNSEQADGAMGGNWNDTTGENGEVSALKDSTGNTTSASVTYTAGGKWGWGGATDAVLKGYLDDHRGGSPVTIEIEVNDISYLLYDVTILVATDTENTSFTAKTINGVSYYGQDGVGVAGDQSWGASRELTITDNNSFTVSGLSGNLSISSNRNGNIRGSVAGVVITAYDGAEISVDLNGTEVNWTNSTIGTIGWMNSTEEAGTYAAFDLTADTLINVVGTGVTTDAIMLSGTGELTLSGNDISLTGPATIRSNSDTASVILNNNLNFSSFGTISGNITLNGELTFSNGGNLVSGAKISNSAKIFLEGGILSFSAVTDGFSTQISGEGEVRVALSSNYANKLSLGDSFTGTTFVASGNFTINDSKFGNTLRLANGVNFQLDRGSTVTFDKDLILDGTTEVHQNNNANLTFNGSVTGNGQYKRKGGGNLIFNGSVDLGVFYANASGARFNGETTLGKLWIDSGKTVDVAGSMTLTEDGGSDFNGTLNVLAGGTLILSGHDVLGYNGGGLDSGVISAQGESSSKVASIVIADTGSMTLSKEIQLKGYTEISSASENSCFNSFFGKITVSGIENEISSGIDLREELTIDVANAGILVISGKLQDTVASNGSSKGWIKAGEGKLVLRGDNTYTCQTKISAGTLVVESANALGRGAVVNESTLEFALKKGTFSNTISGAGSLVISEGEVTFSGSNIYSGGTTVSAGTLVAAHQSALGTGTVKLTASGTMLANGTDSTVTVGTLETVDGSILYFGTSGSATAAGFKSTNTATIASGTLFDASAFESGKKLVEGVDSSLDVSKFTLSSLRVYGATVNSRGASATFAVQDGTLVLSAYTAGTVYNLTWNGTASANVWTSGGEAKPWKKTDGEEASNFETGDSVTFGDTAADKNVKINGVVNPAVLVFTNTQGNDYTFSKADGATTAALVGSTTINKSGTGSVKVDNSVDLSGFSGNMTITEGTLIIEHSADLTVSNVLSGAGTFEKTGTGTMVLSGDNGSFTGTLAVSGGVLKLGSNKALGAGYSQSHADLVDVVVKTGGTLDLNGMTKDRFYGNYTLAGGALINTGAEIGPGSRQLNGGITLTANSEVGGTSNFGMISGGYAANTLNLSGYTLTKTGTNVFYLTNTTITAGTIDIQGGEVAQVNAVATASDVDFIIGTAGALRMNGMDLAVKSITSSGDGTIGLGGATLTLLGNSTITRIDTNGTVSASEGVTLTLVGGRFNTAGFTLAENAVVELKTDSNSNFGSVISGSGSVKKTGSGTMTVSSTNTYAGGTTISEGTLKITKDAALGVAETGVVVEANGTLDLAFEGEFVRSISGAGTVAASGSGELTLVSTNGFSGSFDAKSGLLVVRATEGAAYKNLNLSAGATFKTGSSISFESVSAVGGTLSGNGDSTRVSVASGSFAGTLSNVSLVKTGEGTLDLNNAAFATGGKVVVETGTVSNLRLADGGTLQLSGSAESTITLSNLNVGATGTISVEELFEGGEQATISDTFTIESGSTLTLILQQLIFKTNYELFTFTTDTKSAWETAFGTLTDGKFSGGTGMLVLSGLGSIESGVFSWGGLDNNTLYFKEDRDALSFVWTKTDSEGSWSGENWNDPKVAFSTGMDAVFDETSVSEAFSFEDYTKGASVKVDSVVYAGSVIVKPGADAFVSIFDDGGTLSVANGISVESGALIFRAEDSDFYKGEFKIAKNGTVIFGQTTAEGTTSSLDLQASFSGEGTIRYLTEGAELTLSGDRSAFTGTLDADAGTVVLANGTGTEAFSKIDIAAGAIVAATGGTLANNVSSLTLGQVAGTGTLRAESQGGKYFILDLSGSEFTGTVELNGTDTIFATNANEGVSDGTKVSNLANASSVRLTNGAALNFFNTASTFAQNIEVAATNGAKEGKTNAIRVFGSNTGTEISGNISGAGTLTIKDGGKLILAGAVGTADVALGGLTLSSGILEISGANSSLNISGDVTLSGTSATINTTGTVTGKMTVHGTNSALTLGGTLNLIGGLERVEVTGGDGRSSSVLDNSSITIGETLAFGNNESLNIGKNSSVSAKTVTNTWGLAIALDAGSVFSAEEIDLKSFAYSRFGTFSGAGADSSSVELGKLNLSGNEARASFENVTVKIGADGIVGSGDAKFVQFKDVKVSVLGDDSIGWVAEANLKLNGSSTTFDVAEGKTITLNGTLAEAVETAQGTEGEEGYVAATSSTLIKTGAGTLVLEKANENKGGTEINEGTLKFTNASGVSLGAGVYTFGGGKMSVGANTTLSVGAGTTFSGNAILTSERSGKYLFTDDFSHDKSFTLDSGATVEIADGKTLTLSDLRFTGTAASKINGVGTSGTGVLAVNGKVSVENNRESSITSDLTVAGNTEVSVVSGGILKVTSAAIRADGNTLTKTGAGTLTFGSDAINGYDGSFAILGGTVDVGTYMLSISGENSLTLQNATLKGTLELKGTSSTVLASAALGGGKSTIDGNVSIANTALTFGGKVTGIKELTWGDGNTVTLTDAFRATFSGKTTLIDFESAVDANGEALTAETKFENVFKQEIFLGRDVELLYNETDTTLDITVTGSLQWNGAAYWVAPVAYQTWDERQLWDEVTKNGLVEQNTVYQSGKFVEFTRSGSMTYVGATAEGRFDGNGQLHVSGDGALSTAGMIFNIEGGSFRLSAASAGDEDNLTYSYLQGVERTIDGETKLVDDGISILAGTITFEKGVDNRLTGGMRIFGGELWVAGEEALGDGTVTLGDSAGDAAAKLGLNGNTTLGQKVIIGNAAAVIDVAGRVSAEISNALEKDASATTAALTKTGAGTLTIQRTTALDGIKVSGGKLSLAGSGNVATELFEVGSGATLEVVNNTTDGADSTFKNLVLNGTLAVAEKEAFRAGTISVTGTGTVNGNLLVGAETSFEKITGEAEDGTAITETVYGTALDVAAGAGIVFNGNVASYGSDAAALYKFGSGSLTLKGSSLDADFVHTAGTVVVANNLTASKLYSVDGTVAVQVNTGYTATFNGGFAVEKDGVARVRLNTGAKAVFNGFSAAEGGVTFSGTGRERVSATINDNDNADAVALGDVMIGGLTSNNYFVDLTVDAATASAGVVALGAGSTLKLDNASGSVTAEALVVEYYEGFKAVLDLSSGATLKLENNSEDVAVLAGAGTLEVIGGTLSVKGQNYSSALSPKILLDDATFNFEVAGTATAVSSLSAISTTKNGGAVSKSGSGTLVLWEGLNVTPTADMAFAGTIAANEGDLRVYATMSKADVSIAESGRLTTSASAQLGSGVEGMNTLAKTLSGTGELVAIGTLHANGGLDDFDGKLVAGGISEASGYLYVYGATEKWLSSDVATRGIALENGGTIVSAEEEVTLKAVSLQRDGWLYGDKMTVGGVEATANSTLTLSGTGTLGTLVFAAAAEGETATNTLDLALGDWILNDTATNLSEVSVGVGMLTVANVGALASADVTVSEGGTLKIAADGTYTNAISLDGVGATVWATGTVNLTGALSSDAFATVLFVAGEEDKAGTLTLSEAAFELATNDITFNAAHGKIAVNTENAKTFKGKLAGAGIFEKAGAGTLTVNSNAGTIGTFSVAAGTVEFNSSATIAAYGETDGLLSVAKDASATINGANLSEFVLSGEGAVTVNGGDLAGMKDAKRVSLGAGKTLSVSGDVSGSVLTFGDDKSKLATTGAGAQTVSGTTLSGATVTLVNENAKGSVVYNATLSGTTKLVLSAEKGITGGEFAGAYSGSLEKTEGGKWTVSDYTYGANGGETLNVAGGTLEWKNAKLGANAGTITLGTGATLSVNGLASGDTLSGTVSGDNTTTLEIANSSLTLGTEAAANSAWSLSVSGDNVDEDIVTITKALPGSLKVDGATAKFSLGNGSMEMGDGEQLIVAKASKLELATGTLSVANSSVEKLNTIEGAVTVASGSTFEQKSGIRWNTGSTLDIAGTYSISVGDIGNTGWNKAKVTGSGTLEVAKTSAAGYNISGDISGFAGTLSVAAGAKVNLTDGASFESVEKVVVNNNATFEVSHNLGGELNKLSGTGTVVVNADSAKNDFYNAVYSWGAENNDFTGTVDVNSGTLALKVDQLSALSGKLSVSGDSVATYSETAKAAGAVQGAFLKVVTDNSSSSVNDVDTSIIGQNGGLIFSGGKYVAGATFGTVGNGNLYVVEKDASLTLAANADVNGSLFVTYGSELTLGGTVAAGTTIVRSVGGNNAVSGDFTLNGKLVVAVTDANADKTLLNVGGITKLATGKQGPAEIEIDTSKTTSDVSAWDFTIVNNYKDTRQNLDEVVKVTVMGREVEVSRDGNGNIVVVSAVNDYAAPSGLQDLYSAIRSKGSTALWTFLKSDRANAETMDRKLVGLSPVSYGSLVEMQSGFVALENDLLRDRLEQRRYERAFVSNSSKQFKPFVNILGSERDGKGNGTKSANYDISHAGAIGGFDVAVSRNTIFGVSLGFDWAKANLNDGAGKHEGDSTRLGVYGMSVFDNAYFGYGLSTGATSFDMKRNSGYNGETLTGSTDGNDVNASVLFGAGWTIDEQLGLDLAPYIGFDLGYAYAKSFSEEGGKQTALEVDKIERWSLRGKLGATLSLRASDRLRISLDASLSHEFLDSEADIDAKFASGDLAGTAFSSTAYLMDETTIQIGPRVDYRIDDTWSVSGGYSYETDLDDTVTHSANVGVRARF